MGKSSVSVVTRKLDPTTRVDQIPTESTGRETRMGAAADAIIFVGALIVSALALAAVAVATPIIVAVSLIAGLMFKNAPAKSWRRAGI